MCGNKIPDSYGLFILAIKIKIFTWNIFIYITYKHFPCLRLTSDSFYPQFIDSVLALDLTPVSFAL